MEQLTRSGRLIVLVFCVFLALGPSTAQALLGSTSGGRPRNDLSKACLPLILRNHPAPLRKTIHFDAFPDGTPVKTDTVLHGDEFLADGVRLAGAPSSGYCAGATSAAILVPPHPYGGIDFAFLTTALPDNANSCNTILVEIAFVDAAREVRLTFAGASTVYTMNVYDATGDLLRALRDAGSLSV